MRCCVMGVSFFQEALSGEWITVSNNTICSVDDRTIQTGGNHVKSSELPIGFRQWGVHLRKLF